MLTAYELNKASITEEFCENKSQPELQCNGKCHLMKQLNLESSPKTTQEEPPMLRIAEAFFPLYFQEVQMRELEGDVVVLLTTNSYYNPLFTDAFVVSI